MAGNVRLRVAVAAAALIALLLPAAAHAALPVPSGQPTVGAATTKAVPGADKVFGDLYPACPGDSVVRQPDASTFKGQLTNAEVGGTMEHDGYTVTKRADG